MIKGGYRIIDLSKFGDLYEAKSDLSVLEKIKENDSSVIVVTGLKLIGKVYPDFVATVKKVISQGTTSYKLIGALDEDGGVVVSVRASGSLEANRFDNSPVIHAMSEVNWKNATDEELEPDVASAIRDVANNGGVLFLQFNYGQNMIHYAIPILTFDENLYETYIGIIIGGMLVTYKLDDADKLTQIN